MISQTSITVRYAETDQMGIAHHSVYPIWYEVARTEFIKKLGITYSQMEEVGVLMPLSEVHCNYFLPAHYEDELCITVRIARLTPARIEFAYRVTREGAEAPINTGSTTHAFTDRQLKPFNLKKHYAPIYDLIVGALE